MKWTRNNGKVSGKSLKAIRCSSLIHKRTHINVKYCSLCGEVVNSQIEKQDCDETFHSRKKSEGVPYCSRCGEGLAK